MKAILIQGQGSSMLKTFHIAPCCYPLILGPVCRQKMHSFGYCKFLQNYICIPCKNHENLWSALFALHSNWSQYFLIQTRPSRMGVGVGKDTVRRVHFRVFSTSHFAPTLLSSDWQVLIFRHRHFWSHFFFTNRESQLTFRTELEKVLIFVTFFRH